MPTFFGQLFFARKKKDGFQKPPNMNIIPHLQSSVHAQFLQVFMVFLMEHPILKISEGWVIIKLQKKE